jgi:hypothetical protein
MAAMATTKSLSSTVAPTRSTGGDGKNIFFYYDAADVADGTRDRVQDFEIGTDRLSFNGFTGVSSVHIEGVTIVQGYVGADLKQICCLVGVTAQWSDLAIF